MKNTFKPRVEMTNKMETRMDMENKKTSAEVRTSLFVRVRTSMS